MATTNTNLAYINKLDEESIKNLTNLYNQQGIHSGQLTDMTSQFKQNTGRDNTIGTTIGNASLNNYGYSIVNGQVRQTGTANSNNAPGWYGTANADGSVSSAQQLAAQQPTQTQLGQESSALKAAEVQANASYAKEEAERKAAEEQAYWNNAYMNLYNDYESRLRANNDEYLKYLGEANQNQLNLINQNADNAARQYYQNYLSQKYALPEQLSNLGVTGGASETAALGLMSNYSQNLGQNESNRNTNIANQNIEYNRILAENSKNLADQLADTYLSMAQKQLQLNMDNREKAELEAKQQEVETWNSNVSGNITTRLQQGHDVYYWYDSNGKLHYNMDEDTAKGSGYEYTKLESGAKADALKQSNDAIMAKERERLNQGHITYNWYDDNGGYHYNMNENTAMTSGQPYNTNKPSGYDEKIQAQIQAQNDAEQAKAEAALKAGSKVYTWNDKDGFFHWSTSSIEASKSGYTYKTHTPDTKKKVGSTSDKGTNPTPKVDDNKDDKPIEVPEVSNISVYSRLNKSFDNVLSVNDVNAIITNITNAFAEGKLSASDYASLIAKAEQIKNSNTRKYVANGSPAYVETPLQNIDRYNTLPTTNVQGYPFAMNPIALTTGRK